MSRAINTSLAEAAVEARCKALSISISSLEALPKGGSHVVCTTSEGADALRADLKTKVIAGKVLRFPYMRIASSW